MKNCTNLYYLSSIACMLADCFDEAGLKILSSDLITLGEMIESVLARQCPENEGRVHVQQEC